MRWRGPFGRKSSVVLRAVFPLVLGLGGLCLGVLIVLTTNAGIALTDELVVASSVGVPVALGVYLAWMDRHSVTPTGTGLAAAAAGALVGAWLGFSVTDAGFGFVAPFVAIVGATAGANLALLLLDIAWDHRAVYAHVGIDLLGPAGGVVRVESVAVREVTRRFTPLGRVLPGFCDG